MFKKRKQRQRYLRYLKFLLMPPPKKGDPKFDMSKISLTPEEKQWIIDNVILPG